MTVLFTTERYGMLIFEVKVLTSSLGRRVRPFIINVQESTLRIAPYWIAAALTAVVAAGFAKAFYWSEEIAFRWCEGDRALAFLLTPVAMLISYFLVLFFSPGASGSGIPQLMVAVETSNESPVKTDFFLNFRMIVAKFFGACLCIAGGGVIGREGPMLQIAGGIFNLVQRVFKKYSINAQINLQSMILAGGAAGLASAFNTPLGGVVFAIEELAKVHISRVRTHVFHAVIIAGLLAQAILGNYLYIGRVHVPAMSARELFPLILAVGFAGFLGALSGRAMVISMDFRSRLSRSQQIFLTLALGLLVATMTYVFGTQAIGSGRTVITEILTGTHVDTHFSLPFVRFAGNILTYAGGVIGGVFAPALSTGAAIGSWLSYTSPLFDHQLWALAGMVAFLTGVTRTPFTSLILVFEMTDTHDLIIYLMLAAIIAQGVAKFVDPLSFYEQMAYRLIHGHAPPLNHHHEDNH